MIGEPHKAGGGGEGCLPMLGLFAILVVATFAFLLAQDMGVFEIVSGVGNAVLGVVDELWKQPSS